MCKYKVGDYVEIVNYGSHIYDKHMKAIDMNPEYIGERGIITEAHVTQGIDDYAIDGTTAHSRFHNSQLKFLQMNSRDVYNIKHNTNNTNNDNYKDITSDGES